MGYISTTSSFVQQYVLTYVFPSYHFPRYLKVYNVIVLTTEKLWRLDKKGL